KISEPYAVHIETRYRLRVCQVGVLPVLWGRYAVSWAGLMGVCLDETGGGHPARICSSRANGRALGADFRRRLVAACELRAASGRRSRHVLFYRWLVHGWNERPGPQAPRHKGQTGKIRAQERGGVRRNAERSAAARGVDQHAKGDPVQ